MKLEHYSAVIELHLDGESPHDISSQLGISVATVYRILQVYRATKAAEKIKQMEMVSDSSDFEEEEEESEENDNLFEDEEPTSSTQNLRAMLNGPGAADDRRGTLRTFRGLLRQVKKDEAVDADAVDEVIDQMTDTLTLNGFDSPEESGAVQLLYALKDEVEDGDAVEQKILAQKGLGITDLQDSDAFDPDEYAKEKLDRKLGVLGYALETVNEKEISEEDAQRLINHTQKIKDSLPETHQFDVIDEMLDELISQLEEIKNHDRGFLGLGSLPDLKVDEELLDEIDAAREALGCVHEEDDEEITH